MSMKKIGFTLGEILITLTVVGVVAILTVPSMLNNIGTRQRMEKLKGTVSDINNAIQTFMVQKHTNDLREYFEQDCTLRTNMSEAEKVAKINETKDKCFYLSELLDVKDHSFTPHRHKRLSGQVSTPDVSRSKYIDLMNLKNGVAIAVLVQDGNVSAGGESRWDSDAIDYLHLYIDVNGTEDPNVAGMDWFEVYVCTHTITNDDGEILCHAGEINSRNVGEGEVSLSETCTDIDESACYKWAEQSGFDPDYYKRFR